MERSMKTNIWKWIALSTLTTFALVSCNQDEVAAGGSEEPQFAMLQTIDKGVVAQANFYNPNATDLEEAQTDSVTKKFQVKFGKPLESNVQLYFSYSEKAAERFIAENPSKPFEILPDTLLVLPHQIEVEKGVTVSPMLDLKVGITEDLKLNVPYVFVVQLGNLAQEGVEVFANNDKMVYTLIRREESTDIVKALDLKRSFCLFSKEFANAIDSKYSNSSYTVEGFLNVKEFGGPAAGIATWCGVEGGTLFRFGDAGVPINHMQIALTSGNKELPVNFSTNRWYHIAITFDAPARTITTYVNGKKVMQAAGVRASMHSNGDKRWFIGRSWDDNRGIDAKLAEMRVWKVARSAEDIANNMFGVDKEDPNLISYWKFDKTDGKYIVDATGHGYDMKFYRQQADAPSSMTVVELPEPISLD